MKRQADGEGVVPLESLRYPLWIKKNQDVFLFKSRAVRNAGKKLGTWSIHQVDAAH